MNKETIIMLKTIDSSVKILRFLFLKFDVMQFLPFTFVTIAQWSQFQKSWSKYIIFPIWTRLSKHQIIELLITNLKSKLKKC